MNDTEKQKPPKAKTVWLYHGLVDDPKGPLHSFEKIEPVTSRRTGEFAHFSRDKGKKSKLECSIPAWLYSIENDGNTFVFSTMESLGRWDDEHEAEAIMLAHRARERADKARRQQAKMEAEMKSLSATLAPIARVYRNTNAQGRIAIEIMLIDALRNGWRHR